MDANFQLNRSKVKVTERQKLLKKSPHIWRTCLLTGDGSSTGGSGANCKLDLTIVRPNLLSVPETLNNWMDGRLHSGRFREGSGGQPPSGLERGPLGPFRVSNSDVML